MSLFALLPIDVCNLILLRLFASQIGEFSQACKLFHKIANNSLLWKLICIRDFSQYEADLVHYSSFLYAYQTISYEQRVKNYVVEVLAHQIKRGDMIVFRDTRLTRVRDVLISKVGSSLLSLFFSLVRTWKSKSYTQRVRLQDWKKI